MQRESFQAELQALLSDIKLSTRSRIAPLYPRLGPSHLMRVGGRLSKLASVGFDTRHPIILDGRHPRTKLFLVHMHLRNHHQGIDFQRSLIQQRFWVLKLRSCLRSIKSKCTVCRRYNPQTLEPLMANLPLDRLADRLRPFTNTGVDYFGPLYVTVRRSTQKRWAFLFTSLTTRAVHLEVVRQWTQVPV